MKSSALIPRVVRICQKYPRAANDDNVLIEQFWLSEGWDERKSLYHNLTRVTAPESITRARRKAHELGLITYTDEVDKAREERYKEELEDNSNHAVSWMYD